MANVIFKKGLLESLPTTRDDNTFYITTDEGAIYLGNLHKWLSISEKTINNIEPIIEQNTLKLKLIFSDDTNQIINLIKGIDGDNSTINIDSNGNLMVNVPISGIQNNIIGNNNGLFSRIKPVYNNNTGDLKLQYTFDNSTWNDIPETVNIPLNSFLTTAMFVNDQIEWNDNYDTTYGTSVINEPSFVLVTKTSGNITTNIVIPVSNMIVNYQFNSTDTSYEFITSTSGSVVTINGKVKISGDTNNQIKLNNDGLFVEEYELLISNTETITLNNDGSLNANVNISTTNNNILTSNSNGLYVPKQIHESTNSIIQTENDNIITSDININTITPGNISISVDSNGLKAELNWDNF